MTPRPEEFAAISSASAPTFTRDGRTLLHLRGSGLSQIWALDMENGVERQLTFHDERVAIIRRSPVDDRIVYGFDRGGDERQQLMLLDPGEKTPTPRALTNNPAVIHDWGAWSPDGKQIAYAANDRDEAHFDVYVQDLESGARRCIYQGAGMLSVAGFRPDGAALAIVHDRAYGDMSLSVLDIDSGEAAPFPQPGGTNYQTVRWASDGKTLLALTDHGGKDFPRLCRLDPETGGVSVVYTCPGREIEGWATSADGATLATVENDRGYSVLRVGSIDGDRAEIDGLPRGVVGEPAFSPDGAALVFTASSPTSPGAIWMWRDGFARRLWQPFSPVDPAAFVDLQLIEWESFDGMCIPGFLALPRTLMPAGGHRAIIWVHGGPVSQSRPNFRPDIQMLLSQGFAVLLPNVRGSSGYGRAYAEIDDVEHRLDSVHDLAAAHDWLADHPVINDARIGIMGQSYGGYMVNAAITEYPDLWRAAVSYYSIVDFVTTLEGTGPWRRSHRAAEYGDPVEHAELFKRISPIHHVDRIEVPVLLAHGARDPRVPIGESEQLEQALRERQKPVTYLAFDYAGHGFVRPDDKRRIFAAVAEFLTRHV